MIWHTIKKSVLICLLASFVSVASFAFGAEIKTENARQKMAQFKANHPRAVFFGSQYFESEGFFEQMGSADFVYGAPMSAGETSTESAWNFYRQIEGIYAEEAGTLVPGTEQGIIWDRATGTHKFKTFRFQQKVNGIPVYRSGIGFLVRNEENYPVVMASNNLKEMKGFDVAGIDSRAPARATDKMIANAAKALDEAGPVSGIPREDSILDFRPIHVRPLPVVASDEQLVVFAGVSNVQVKPMLAIAFTATRGDWNDMTQYQKHLVVASASNGEILYSENMMHGDVTGTVYGRATASDRASECAPEALYTLPYAQVREVGTTNAVFSDVDGNFTLPKSGTGPVAVRSLLNGKYFRIFDNATNEDNTATPFIDWNVFSNGTVSFLHNPNDTEFPTANVNCYRHANIIRDFVLSFEPDFPVIGAERSFPILTNQSIIYGGWFPITSCNAVYTGESIIFMRNLGLCNNTAISDVIYHEYGHHLVNVTGNGQGQFGEGAGDAIGVLIEDDPILGRGFFKDDCTGGIRSANAFRSYPCGDEYTDIHDCGQLLSGVVWDTLNEIRTVDPVGARDTTASLFIGMLVVRGNMGGGRMIGPEVPNIFVTLDDDDGFADNGTPHIEQLAAAFNPRNLRIDLPGAEELRIAGTGQRDRIIVSQIGDAITVKVNDAPATTHSRVTVSQVAIYGYGGADLIRVIGSVPSFISGGAGPDDIFGGSLANEIEGGPGADMIAGGPLGDIISGGGGQDMIDGGLGNDIIYGNDAADYLVGGGGDDEIHGGLGVDTIYGGAGRDDLYGEDGSDSLFGGGGNDSIFGNDGNDLLHGGVGSDNLFGGNDNDTFFGGLGFDIFVGFNGIDTGLDAGEYESDIENSQREDGDE